MIVATVLPVARTTNLDNNQLEERGVSSNDNSPVNRGPNYCLWSGNGSNLMNIARTPSIDLSSFTQCQLELYMQFEVYSPDHAFIALSTDGGVTWPYELMVINGVQVDWNFYRIDISSCAAGQSNVKIEFVYNTGPNSQSKGWHIDLVTIRANGNPILVEGFESGIPPGWTIMGWTIVEKHAPPVTKWVQWPDTTPNGIDVCADRVYIPYYPRLLADDFQCKSSGYITNISLWGSWLHDEVHSNSMYVHLAIYADIPVNQSQTGYSMPGALLWERSFTAGQFKESVYYNGTSEWWWDPYSNFLVPNTDHIIYQYDFSIPQAQAFYQEGSATNPVTYWLGLYVNSSSGAFGWKTSWQHWNDDATYSISESPWWKELRYPVGHPYYNRSIDMAFLIITTGGGVPPIVIDPKDTGLASISVDVTNIGQVDIFDLDWRIETGGGHPWYPKMPKWNGTIPSIRVNETVTIRSGLFLGFGLFNLTIRVDGATPVTRQGFIFVFIIFVSPE